MIYHKLSAINEFVSNELWFDFQVKEFDGYKLSIIGGIDLFHDWMMEVYFKDVSFCLIKNEWKRNDDRIFLEVLTGKKAFDLNKLYHIEVGNILFKINHEDINDAGTNGYIIAAKELDFNIKMPAKD